MKWFLGKNSINEKIIFQLSLWKWLSSIAKCTGLGPLTSVNIPYFRPSTCWRYLVGWVFVAFLYKVKFTNMSLTRNFIMHGHARHAVQVLFLKGCIIGNSERQSAENTTVCQSEPFFHWSQSDGPTVSAWLYKLYLVKKVTIICLTLKSVWKQLSPKPTCRLVLINQLTLVYSKANPNLIVKWQIEFPERRFGDKFLSNQYFICDSNINLSLVGIWHV